MTIKTKLENWVISLKYTLSSVFTNNLRLSNKSKALLDYNQNTSLEVEENKLPSLEEILDSVPSDYRHPEDLEDFLESKAQGRELI